MATVVLLLFFATAEAYSISGCTVTGDVVLISQTSLDTLISDLSTAGGCDANTESWTVSGMLSIEGSTDLVHVEVLHNLASVGVYAGASSNDYNGASIYLKDNTALVSLETLPSAFR